MLIHESHILQNNFGSQQLGRRAVEVHTGKSWINVGLKGVTCKRTQFQCDVLTKFDEYLWHKITFKRNINKHFYLITTTRVNSQIDKKTSGSEGLMKLLDRALSCRR